MDKIYAYVRSIEYTHFSAGLGFGVFAVSILSGVHFFTLLGFLLFGSSIMANITHPSKKVKNK